MSNEQIYLDALRRIVAACANPYGKDARLAKRIAKEAIRLAEEWGSYDEPR